MSTGARLENTVSGGISGIKAHMKAMQNSEKEVSAKAVRMEKENEQMKHTYLRSYGRQQGLRDRRTNIEEKLEKNEEKMKEVSKRLQEKEKFLEESKKFNRSLKHVAPDEGAVAEMEERVKEYKGIYNKNYERYQKARNIKIELEQQSEIAELKAHEAMRKVDALKTELEYNIVEEARRTEGCREAIDAAFKAEKNTMDIQRGLDVIMRRKEEAIQKINKLEKEVTKAENAIDTLNFERRRMEATIKEMLISLKQQGGSG